MATDPWPQYPVPLPPQWAANPACAHLRAAELRLARLHLKIEPDDVVGPVRGLIVGEAPGPTGKLPMFPWPAHSSGGRLLKMSGMTPGQYLGRFRRLDLSMDPDPKKWSAVDARAEAARVRDILDLDLEWRRSSRSDAEPLRVLLLGNRVAKAFGIDLPGVETVERDHTYLAIPHPSGRNRVYDDPQISLNVGIAVRWAAGYMG